MPKEQNRNESAILVRLAGINVPKGRLDALEAGLSAARSARASFSKYDLGVIEPASRFTVPPAGGADPATDTR